MERRAARQLNKISPLTAKMESNAEQPVIATEINASSTAKTAIQEAKGTESASRVQVGDIGPVKNSTATRVGTSVPNRQLIRVSRDQAISDVYADAKIRGVEIRSGSEAIEYLDYAARQQGIPPEAMHATNLGDDLIFVR